MRAAIIASIVLAIALATLPALAAPTPTPVAAAKNVFRPENIGMGYKGRASSGPRNFAPFPGMLGRILGPKDAEPRVDRVDAVDRVDRVDGVDCS